MTTSTSSVEEKGFLVSVSASLTPRLLVIENDADIQALLMEILEEEGYVVSSASSQEEALRVLEGQTFHLILTDLFANKAPEALASVPALQAAALPTPVGILTGWPVSPEQAAAQGFAFCMAKPFEITELLTAIAGALHRPLTPAQQRQARVVRAYFDQLTARDWDAFVALCTEEVTYYLPGASPFAATITGQAALRAYTADTYRQFPGAWFEDPLIFSRPNGLAARYKGHWPGPNGQEHSMTGAVLFQFEGERIQQIGVRLNDERLRALWDQQQEQGAIKP